jgi:nitrogen fixation protein FixH
MSDKSDGFRITGRFVLLAFIAFFGVVIVTDMVFVRLAVSSFPGEEVKKSYYQGLQFNDQLAEKAEQSARGWKLTLVDLPEAGGERSIAVRLANADDKPLSGIALEGTLIRPVTDTGARELAFRGEGAGIYRAGLAGVEPGAWKLRIVADDAAEDTPALDAETRLILP